MKKIRLGKISFEVSAIGFGGIPIQTVSWEEAVAAVRKSIELGINYIDTARVYTDSEEKIGTALEGVNEEVFLASKTIKRDYEGAREDINITLSNLGRDSIDLYQLHNIMTEDDISQIFGEDGAYRALLEAKGDGKIAHIGITSHSIDTAIIVMKKFDFETLMIPFNYIEQDPMKELIPLALEKDIGLIFMKPLGGGSFEKPGAALRFILEKEIGIAIPGMKNVLEVKENISTAEGEWALSDEDIAYLDSEKDRLGDNFCRRCDYCQPCTTGIKISLAMRLEQLFNLSGWHRVKEESFQEVINSIEGCIECGDCEDRCPYQLPIRKIIRQQRDIVLKRQSLIGN